ncbi:MAG: prepilin-type N-terminal cleavage/methylation domain-containing protein [candidate division KSB1 bacterium]|nr:prepilin-type N-terminal cleavage/methylation domain-containing protein [candidate division KSB1 bacterium]
MGNEKGFTLLEVLVSVSLLTIGVVSLLSFYSQSSQFHVRQHERLLAFQLAMERIEAIRQVVLEKGGAAVSPTAYPDDQVLNSTLFLRKTRIHKISDRLLEVTVTVIYPNGRVQLTTRLLQWQN